MFSSIVRSSSVQNAVKKLVRNHQNLIGMQQIGASRCISKSKEHEMNVDYLTFNEQQSPLIKDKKYTYHKSQRYGRLPN